MAKTIHTTYPSNGAPVDGADEPIELMGRDGWIAVARTLRDHHLVGFGRTVRPANEDRGFCYSRSEAWLDLIMECRYSAGTVMNKGRPMAIRPGQLLGAVSWLGHRWNWSPKTVRWFIDALEKDGMLTKIRTGPDYSLEGTKEGNQQVHFNGNQPNILTISNYELYQLVIRIEGQPKGQPERQPNGNRTATEGPPKGESLTKEQGNKKERDMGSSDPLPLSESQAEIESAKKPPPTKLAAPDAPSATAADALKAFESYNALAMRIGLPIARTMTPARREGIQCRLREHGGLEGWDQALANIEKSGFLRGKNDRNWRASLDFLIQARSFSKVYDGTYGNGAHVDFYHDTKPPAAAPALPLVPVDLDESWAKARAMLPTEEEGL